MKQVDFDGTMDHSPVVVVMRSDAAATIYPNPTEGQVSIRKENMEHAEVSILNSELQLVRTARLSDGDPMLNLGDLPDGMYLLLLRTPAGTEALRVVKASRSH